MAGGAGDVADRVRAEEALRASESHLRDVNRYLEQFVYSASHDLQEPIRNVAIHSQMIDLRYKHLLPADGWDHFAYVVEGAKRMGNLVQDLLEYTRASKFDDEPVDFIDATKVLDTVVADLKLVWVESTPGEGSTFYFTTSGSVRKNGN